MSTAERLRNEGKVLGKAEGKADTLRRLLARRFGQVPEAIARRIEAGALEDLDRWTDRILDAASIDDVFARD